MRADRWERAFRALAAPPRRRLLLALFESPPDRPLSLPDAATSPRASDCDRRRLAIRLRHAHLPTLADAGYVTWTDDPLAVERGPNFEEVAVVLDALRRYEGPLSRSLDDGSAPV